MLRTSVFARAARLLVVAAWSLAIPVAFAGEAEDLSRAVELFHDGSYLAAKEMLNDIDPDDLSDAQQAQRIDYLSRVQVALTMVEKADRDFEAGIDAADAGRLDEAERLLRQVLENEYASSPLRVQATNEMQRVSAARRQGGSGTQQATATGAASPSPTRVEEVQVQPISPPAGTYASAPGGVGSQRARMLTDEGYKKLGAGRFSEARTLFEQALQASPGYPEATRGLQRVAGADQVDDGPTSLIGQLEREAQINWRRTVARYREAETQVREHVLHDRYDEAGQVLLRARQIVESGRQYARPLIKYESLLSEYQALADWVADEDRRFNEDALGRQRSEVADKQRERQQLIRENRERQIGALMEQAMRLRKDGEYRQAMDALEQVLTIDPHNDQARFSLDVLEDVYSRTSQRRDRNDFYREGRDALRDLEEAKIPWHDTAPRYPSDWLEIISSPERSATGRERLSPQDLALHDKLEEPVAVAFEDQPFEEVIDQIAEGQGVNITVNWNDLEMYGIDRDSPVTLQFASQVTIKKALEEILDFVGGGEVELAYIISDGVLKIATKDLLDRNVYVDVYDIRDLLMVVPDFTDAPSIDLTQTSGGGGGRGGGGGDSIFGGGGRGGGSGGRGGDEGGEGRETRILDLLDLIRNTIEPDSWRFNGGLVASISEINGQLVVTQTASAHEEVADLLNKLREQQAIQVAIESRFITVQSNFLEELGLDLDIVLNNGNANFDFIPSSQQGVGQFRDPITGASLLLPRSFSELGFAPFPANAGQPLTQQFPGQGQGGQGQQGININQPYGAAGLVPGNQFSGGTPVPVVSNLLQITDPSNIQTDLPGSFGGGGLIQPALNVFGSFLDNIQVDFLIRATQADQRSTVLTAPRLVLFNGQRSWVAVVNQQSFVSELQPVVASGAAAQAPQIGNINTGAVLDVRATVSADRRYVTMTLLPGVGRLLDIQTFLFTTGPNVGAGASGFVQLPTIARQVIRTTVSVPDGGTLLIGGQKIAGEIEVEAGVPILSKIPVLKRLYSARTLVKDEQVLLILVKPRIIIQKEAEQRAFPTFSSRG